MTRRTQIIDWGARAGVAAVIFVSFAATSPGYASTGSLYLILDGAVLVGLVATGLAVTMIAGELDLSVGSVAAVGGILAIKLSPSLGLVPGLLVIVSAGTLFGLVQGALIARLKISSLVFTLGTLISMRGVAQILSGEATLSLPLSDIGLAAAVSQRMLGILSPGSLTLIGVMIVVGIFLRYHPYGREVFAVGGGRDEARAAGVRTNRPIVLAFAISAALSALAGALSAVRSASASPTGFEEVLLAGVAAALVGGISLYGGRGTIVGLAIGVLALRLLIAGFNQHGAPLWTQELATGFVLLTFVLVDLAGKTSPVRVAIRRWLVARRREATPAASSGSVR